MQLLCSSILLVGSACANPHVERSASEVPVWDPTKEPRCVFRSSGGGVERVLTFPQFYRQSGEDLIGLSGVRVIAPDEDGAWFEIWPTGQLDWSQVLVISVSSDGTLLHVAKGSDCKMLGPDAIVVPF